MLSGFELYFRWVPLMTSRFASLTEQDIEKVAEDKDSQTQKGRRRWQRSGLLITWKREKLRELEEKKELAEALKTFYVQARKKGFVQCIIKQLLDAVFAISRIIKVSVRVISLSLRPQLITATSNLIILDIAKTSSNNCLLFSELPVMEVKSKANCFNFALLIK